MNELVTDGQKTLGVSKVKMHDDRYNGAVVSNIKEDGEKNAPKGKA